MHRNFPPKKIAEIHTIHLGQKILQGLLPGVAHPMAHPLPPEHSIGPEHKVTATPGPAGAETESSSEYDAWRY